MSAVHLHTQAITGLDCAKTLVQARYPMYGLALQQLEAARQAIEALYAIEQQQGAPSGQGCSIGAATTAQQDIGADVRTNTSEGV
jgi:hypothetical protein